MSQQQWAYSISRPSTASPDAQTRQGSKDATRFTRRRVSFSDDSPYHNERHARYSEPRAQDEYLHHQRSRHFNLRPPADATVEELWRYFKNLPTPARSTGEPMQVVIRRWAKWLVEVKLYDNREAYEMARMYVEERWKDDDRAFRIGERPAFDLQRRHYSANDIERLSAPRKSESTTSSTTRSPELESQQQVPPIDQSSPSRGRPRQRRVHWSDQEPAKVSTEQPKSMQTAEVKPRFLGR